MSKADYLRCNRCDAKVIYDAEVDYDVPNFGAIWALCADCLKGHEDIAGVVSAILSARVDIKLETTP